ncbi:hypothetical protein JOC37_001201 [Desulfohalotomaculum tongense]|uniref:hypothetical protein n=1 Tax=Desulforadius tongensis TaxID=1216062 RepID=UPI00195A72B4|nr:hypothetical protein [Desulforadius tongensis]MBM7854823.1 hypothetical protein [Desulforadius tongensis]
MKQVDFDDREKLGQLLAELYQAQKQILFQEMVMQIFMERTGLTEEQVITMLKRMLQEGWLVAGGCKPKFFLRPGYVASFPVVVSRKGIDFLKEKGYSR